MDQFDDEGLLIDPSGIMQNDTGHGDVGYSGNGHSNGSNGHTNGHSPGSDAFAGAPIYERAQPQESLEDAVQQNHSPAPAPIMPELRRALRARGITDEQTVRIYETNAANLPEEDANKAMASIGIDPGSFFNGLDTAEKEITRYVKRFHLGDKKVEDEYTTADRMFYRGTQLIGKVRPSMEDTLKQSLDDRVAGRAWKATKGELEGKIAYAARALSEADRKIDYLESKTDESWDTYNGAIIAMDFHQANIDGIEGALATDETGRDQARSKGDIALARQYEKAISQKRKALQTNYDSRDMSVSQGESALKMYVFGTRMLANARGARGIVFDAKNTLDARYREINEILEVYNKFGPQPLQRIVEGESQTEKLIGGAIDKILDKTGDYTEGIMNIREGSSGMKPYQGMLEQGASLESARRQQANSRYQAFRQMAHSINGQGGAGI